MSNKRVLFVTTHFYPDNYMGGVVESGTKLVKYLRENNADLFVICVSKQPLPDTKKNIYCQSFLFHRFGFSITLLFKLFLQIKRCDKVFINGIVTFPCSLAQLYCIILQKPFINSLRGGLEEWRIKHKYWKKAFIIFGISIPFLRKSKFIHTTSEEEKLSALKYGFNNCFVASNGIDLEDFQIVKNERSDSQFVFLFLSRKDKEKGIEILLEAYEHFCKKFQNKNHVLKIVGPDNQGYFQKLKHKYNMKNVVVMDGVYGSEKVELISNSHVFILPSFSENFGNVIAEALVCRVPVITTNGTPWKIIEREECGFIINPDSNELLQKMIDMFQAERKLLVKMGENGRKLIFAKYDWKEKANIVDFYLKKI